MTNLTLADGLRDWPREKEKESVIGYESMDAGLKIPKEEGLKV